MNNKENQDRWDDFPSVEEFLLVKCKGMKKTLDGTPQKKLFPVPPPSDIFVTSVQVQLEREKDQHNPKRLRLAEKFRHSLGKELSSLYRGKPSDSCVQLMVYVVLASDGSRRARMLGAADLGFGGHIQSTVAWILRNPSQVCSFGRTSLRDESYIGPCADVCDGRYGEHVLLHDMVPKMVERIAQHL